MRSRSCCLICWSFPRIRLRIVLRFTVKNPFPFFPLMCANPRNRTSRALPHPFVSGSVRHTARTRSGAFYLDEVPAQTSPAVPEGSLGIGLLPLDAGILGRYRPHSERQPRRLAHTSCAKRPPTDRKHNADRYWQALAISPTLAEYLSLFPTTCLPPSPLRSAISES